MRRSMGLVLALALTAPFAASALTLTAQERSVEALAYYAPHLQPPTQVHEAEAAADFGPFDASVSAGAGFAAAWGSQSSALTLLPGGSLQVDAAGSSSNQAVNYLYPFENSIGQGESSSLFEIVFAVDVSMPYELSARVFGSNVLNDPMFEPGWLRRWNAHVELRDAGGEVLAQLVRGSALGDPFGDVDETQLFSGVLAPGSYTLFARADGWAAADWYNPGFSLARAGYELDFTAVPEPSVSVLLALGLAGIAARRAGARGQMRARPSRLGAPRP